MSKIDKLSILGVRSFDNNANEVIKFYAPLTLIVGYNGSGKTTIIECLKYATTGDLPPNTKGGAFIHDPKLCGEKEVRAQVKLSFKSTTGASMVATRSLQLTVQKSVRRQKTLEGQLLMLRGGERLAVSSRVAELDQIMPQHLGVSKAILDNVIFCHQDESLWPMSEPSVLKKKFDEIFEALKYTKAIENIKVLKKQQAEELSKLKILEQHAKEAKDKGEIAEQRSRQLSDDIESMREKITELGDRINTTTEKAKKAWDSCAQFERILGQLETKRTQAQLKESNVNELKQHLHQMTNSDEELNSMLKSYDDRAQLYGDEIKTETEHYHELNQTLNSTREKLGKKQGEKGRLQAEKDHYDRQLRNRENLVKETARKHNIRGFDNELDDKKVLEFTNRISKMAREQNAAFERARDEMQKEQRAVQVTLNQLNEKKSALNQRKENCKSQTSLNENKIAQHQSNLNSIEVDEGSKSKLESNRAATQSQIDRTRTELDSSSLDGKISEISLQLRDTEEKKEALDSELVRATKQASDTAAVDVMRKSLKDNEQSLDTMKGAHGSKIAKVMGESWDSDDLENSFQRLLNEKSDLIKDAERQRDGVSRELSQLNFKLDSVRTDLQQKEALKLESHKRVSEALDPDPVEEYENILRDLESSRDICKSDLEGYSHLKDYYDKCSKFFEERDTCKLCERPFKLDSERSRFKKKLEKMVSDAIKSLSESELASFEAELKKVKDAGPSFETWSRLDNAEIPKLVTEKQRLEPMYDKLVQQLEEQDSIIEERVSDKREVESISKTIQNIIKYKTEIIKSQQQIEELNVKQSQAGLSRSASEIHDEQRTLGDRIKNLKQSLSSNTENRDKLRNLLSNLTTEIHEIDTKLRAIDHQLERKREISAMIEDLENSSKAQRESLKEIDTELRELGPQISQAQAKLDDIEQRAAEKNRQLQEGVSIVNDSVNRLKTIEQDIQSYVERNGPEQLGLITQELETLQSEQRELEKSLKEVTVKINELQKQETKHKEMQRQISDNVRFREHVRSLEVIRGEIRELETHNAHSDRDKYASEANKWDVEHARLSSERSSLMGQMKSKDDQLMQLLQDWNTEYKDAAYNYRKAHIKVEATKAAVEDLGRYGSALDKAIMTYHSLKMEEINRIIEELWKKTYQGTDVDTILIRSEGETSAGNKSYNYRVCMIKQDAEMDMRGRCSAGQRVLASIIIRLALAECFGVNCGLIALDEPTTNLDQDNIRSLAESLHDIIKSRQQQSNFQLIVITHDEEFLRYMQCADFCDYYYRVSRNISQKSIIERQSISEVL